MRIEQLSFEEKDREDCNIASIKMGFCHEESFLNDEFSIMISQQIDNTFWNIGKYSQSTYFVKGWSRGNGSGTMTSRPAAEMTPVVRASNKSSWLTRP